MEQEQSVTMSLDDYCMFVLEVKKYLDLKRVILENIRTDYDGNPAFRSNLPDDIRILDPAFYAEMQAEVDGKDD